jgi:hypothetical protein
MRKYADLLAYETNEFMEVKGMTNLPAESFDLNEEKKTAEDYLIHYAFYKEQLEAQKTDIIESSPGRDDMPSREKYAHGNPTCNKAMKLIKDDILRTERWLKAVEATRAHFARADSNRGVFITMRYDIGMSARQIALDLGIGKTSVFSFQNEILSYLIGAHDALTVRS